MNKVISKAKATILLAMILVGSAGAYHIFHDQRLPINQTHAQQSSLNGLNLASTFMMSAAPVALNDSNWAGYIVASDLQNPQPTVTGISASWIVPTVMPSSQRDTFSAVWIGIGGYFDTTLLQTGTEQDHISGQSEYSVWFEFLPDFSMTIDTITVSPGDQINASIQLVDSNTNTWSIYIEDVTTGQTFKNDFTYVSSQLSAEWIVERPEITSRRSRGTLTSLADVGTVSFTNCQATIGEQSGNISSFPVLQSVMYNSILSATGITQLTAVSSLTNNGSSFKIETSQSAIPELSAWAVLPIIMATMLFAVVIQRFHFSRNKK